MKSKSLNGIIIQLIILLSISNYSKSCGPAFFAESLEDSATVIRTNEKREVRETCINSDAQKSEIPNNSKQELAKSQSNFKKSPSLSENILSFITLGYFSVSN